MTRVMYYLSKHDTVEDLYNAILCNAMIHITQKFLNINNAFYNDRNIDTFLKKRSSEFKISKPIYKAIEPIHFQKK